MVKVDYTGRFIDSSISAVIIGFFNLLIAFVSFKGFNIYGLILLVVGECIYGFHNFLMGNMWSANVEPKKKLIKTGWFKFIRHPLYFGAAVASLGLAFLLMSFYALVYTLIVVFPYVYIRARREEKLLSKTLKGYKEYMKTTGMFFPKFR